MIDNRLLEALKSIPPDDYDEWLSVGIALKCEGASCDVWDAWSRGGSKYKSGVCEKKWETFDREELSAGTIFHIARQHGYTPEQDGTMYDLHHLVLDDLIVDAEPATLELVPSVSDEYDPKKEMLEYFTTLFRDDDYVGLCTDFYLDDKHKWQPSKTTYRQTAGFIIEKLRTGSITNAIGTTNEQAGAYVRFNPLDGKGQSNKNVTRWTYCLIESDSLSIEKQYHLLKTMNLPMHSTNWRIAKRAFP